MSLSKMHVACADWILEWYRSILNGTNTSSALNSTEKQATYFCTHINLFESRSRLEVKVRSERVASVARMQRIKDVAIDDNIDEEEFELDMNTIIIVQVDHYLDLLMFCSCTQESPYPIYA